MAQKEENGVEHSEFWEFVERTSKEVATWPDWKKEGWDMLEKNEGRSANCSSDQPSTDSWSVNRKFL